MTSSLARISLTDQIVKPHRYVISVKHEYKGLIFKETEVPNHKSQWAQQFSNAFLPLDLEIGVGIGVFFYELCSKNLNRNHLGLELKYKNLVRAIKKITNNKLINAKLIRYNAAHINDVFENEEINNVYILFPDPWSLKRIQLKHRLIKKDFLTHLFEIQKKESFVILKTDDCKYFETVLTLVKDSNYKIENINLDFHLDKINLEIPLTHFEKIWIKEGKPIKYIKFWKV